MTPQDQGEILAILAGGWPNHWNPESRRLWMAKLAPLDRTCALGAIEMVLDTCDYPPSWAKFHEIYLIARRKQRSEESTHYVPLDGDAPEFGTNVIGELMAGQHDQAYEGDTFEKILGREWLAEIRIRKAGVADGSISETHTHIEGPSLDPVRDCPACGGQAKRVRARAKDKARGRAAA